MALGKIVTELEKMEDRLDKVADNYLNRGVEGKADRLYNLSERIRKARQELEYVVDTLERQFPGHNTLG
jgi:exonuclease VII small subunit